MTLLRYLASTGRVIQRFGDVSSSVLSTAGRQLIPISRVRTSSRCLYTAVDDRHKDTSYVGSSAATSRRPVVRPCARSYCTSKSGSTDGDDKNGQLSTESVDTFVSEIKNELRQMADSQRRGKEQVDCGIPKETDFVIIGGGSFGLSVAYWLKKRHPDGFSLTVVERDPTVIVQCHYGS